MSVSHKLAEALMLSKTLKSKKLMTIDFPINRSLHSKHQLIQCRRCKGTGTKDNSADNCSQCGGSGTEKISMKAYNRQLKKEQIAVRTLLTQEKKPE